MTLKEKFDFYSAEANKLRDFCKVYISKYSEKLNAKAFIKITHLKPRTGEEFERLRDFANLLKLKEGGYFGIVNGKNPVDEEDVVTYTEFFIEGDEDPGFDPNAYFYVEIDAYYF